MPTEKIYAICYMQLNYKGRWKQKEKFVRGEEALAKYENNPEIRIIAKKEIEA